MLFVKERNYSLELMAKKYLTAKEFKQLRAYGIFYCHSCFADGKLMPGRLECQNAFNGLWTMYIELPEEGKWLKAKDNYKNKIW
jgi:hypothetical protein